MNFVPGGRLRVAESPGTIKTSFRRVFQGLMTSKKTFR